MKRGWVARLLIAGEETRLDADQNSKFISASRGTGDLLKRRDLLQRAAWILPVSLLLIRWAGAAQNVSPVLAKLSAYMAEACTEKLPDKVVRDAKHYILDTIAAVVSGENARGTPRNPMTGEEVVRKARALITPVLGAAASAKLIDRLLDIDTVKNVRELRLLLQR